MPRYVGGRKTALADVEDKLKAEYPGNAGAVWGTLNKIGLARGNKATDKGRAPAKFKEHKTRRAYASLALLLGLSSSAWAQNTAYQNPQFPQSSRSVQSFTVAASSSHTAGDVVGPTVSGVIEFTGICPAPRRDIIISSTTLRYDLTAIPSGMTSFTVWLYNETPPSALADDAPWDFAVADRAMSVGYVDLGSPVDKGSTLFVQLDGAQHQVTCGNTQSLFGYVITNGAYTTVNTDVVTIALHAVHP